MSTLEEILDKARHYCSYQERSKKEVGQKVRSWKATDDIVDQVISKLEEEGFINEQRYAREYAAGKFRNNGWGLHKIRYELNRKGIPGDYIEEALSALEEEEDIDDQVLKLLQKKAKEISKGKPYEKKQKLIRFAMSRGFNMDRILRVINEYGDELLR